ncbi:MAG: peptidoglycan DD-metalloendopeptidase family protein [Anaerolineaceae bacterium]
MNEFDDLPDLETGKSTGNMTENQNPMKNQVWRDRWEKIVRLGLGEISIRIGTAIASVALVLLVVWIMGRFYLKGEISASSQVLDTVAISTPTALVELPAFIVPDSKTSVDALTRYTDINTLLPDKPRYEITTYVVQKGDFIYGIAEKFGLEPETILWGNLYTLGDDPHNLQPGQELNILPEDGVLHRWSTGEGLNGVSEYYGVTPEDIINWPGNHLDVATLGEFPNPNIPNGTDLFVPGGRRGFVTWSAPRISRSNPAVAKILGPGYCGVVVDGAVGNGTFVWPTTARYLSGYDYSTSTNHLAIDIGGSSGNAIYASDNGVVVYSGWNNYGYGNMVVIDHGGGWQTLYAHLLSDLLPACGSSVYQGDMIAYMGSTGNSSGPHLHFEMMSDTYGKVDPKLFLQ